MQPNAEMRMIGNIGRNAEDTTSLLKFIRDKKGNLISRHYNMVVFVDNYYLDIVNEGESWICNLKTAERCWYAIPMIKVDSQFFMGVTKDQIKDMSKCLWECDKELVISEISGSLIEENERLKKDRKTIIEESHKISDDNSELLSEIESLKTEMTVLKDDIEKKNREIKELQPREPENIGTERYESIISALKKEIQSMRMKDQSMRLGNTISNKAIFLGPNEIFSPQFVEDRYDAMICVDGKFLVLTPTDDGNIECINNTLSFNGLELFTEFSGQRELGVTNDDNKTIVKF